MVASGEHIGIVDPHWKCIKRTHDGQPAGKRYRLQKFFNHQSNASCFHGIFNFSSQAAKYNATLFRFPLRCIPSKISKNIYTTTKIKENLFKSFQSEAPIILMFLKNVLKVSLYEWNATENKPNFLYGVEVHDNCKEMIQSERGICKENAEKYLAHSPRTFVQVYTSTFVEKTSTESLEHNWLIVNVVGSDDATLRNLGEDLKVLPWVGVAVQLPHSTSLYNCHATVDEVNTETSICRLLKKLIRYLQSAPLHIKWSGEDKLCTKGQAFCFLPLPCNTALPVHVHGYFAVSDNRRSIKWPSHDEKGEQAEWNKQLLFKLISPAYAILLACRSSMIHYYEIPALIENTRCITDPYSAWPLYSEVKNQPIWSELVYLTLTLASQVPLVWTAAEGGKWVKLTDAYYLPGSFDQIEQNPIAPNFCPEITSQVLIEAGIPVVTFPSEVCLTVSSCPSLKKLVTGREISPKLVRDHIRQKEMNTIISADISQQLDLLDYILSDLDQSTYSELIGIPLLHLLNSHCTLSSFQPPSISNVMYVFKAEQRVALQFLSGIEHKVIDLEVFPPKIQSQLICIAESGVLQFQIATPDSISTTLLKESIMTWCRGKDRDKIWRWIPGQDKHPPIHWISKVWLWLNYESIHLTELEHLPLIPQEITMCEVHLIELSKELRLCTLPDLSSAHLKPVLQKLGFIIISHHKFPAVFRHPQIQEYVHTATPQLLLSHIKSQDVHCLDDEQKDFLRQFLASRYAYVSAIPGKEKKCLRSLPIYRAGIGISVTRLVCLEDDGLVIPPSNPALPSRLRYPDSILSTAGVEEISLTLIKKLAVKQLPFDDFCIHCLVPFALQCIQQSLFEWSNGDEIVLWILKQVPFSSALKVFLAKSKLIRTQANFAVSLQPNQLYNPKDIEFCVLFDSNSESVFPSDKYSCVLESLKCLGLKTWQSMKSCHEMLASLMLSRSEKLIGLLPHNRTTALKRSKFILAVISNLARPNSREFSLWKRIEGVPFLFVQSRPPENYPSCLQWFGQAHQSTLHSICDICFPSCDQQSSAHLIGSVKFMLSEEYEDNEYALSSLSLTGLFDKIQMCNVTQQLSNLIKAVGHNEVEKVNCIVLSIYAYLSANMSSFLASSLPKEWIWWKDMCQFLPPEKVVLQLPTDLHANLEPYLFCIAKNGELNSPKLKNLFEFCEIKKLDSDSEPALLINIMQEIRCKKLSDMDLNIVLSILNWLHRNKYESHDDILMPTVACSLLPARECTFDDREWIRQKTSIPNMSRFVFVHEKVTTYLAKYFHVRPLSESVAPSTRLGIKYTLAGPHEEITQRIKHIVQDYGTNIDIFKELIQNADDAGATEVKFLIDWRTHSSSSLFGCELQPWQGPALLAYNNAVFSDQDLEHICQLAAETKKKDPLKTGRFGVGFCATYQLTDLPSFISRQYFVMFDPHTMYLGDRVSAREPGIKIDLIETQDDLKVYEDQFAPFDDVFGCNVFSLPKDGYRGTLFRFPFRSNETKFRSLISRREYSRTEISHLVESLQESAEEILIFLKHIQKLTVFEVDEEAQSGSDMMQIFAVDRDSETVGASLLKQYQSNDTFQAERSSYCHIKTCLPKGKISQSKWLLSSAIGSLTGQNKMQELTQNNGLAPLAEVAVKVREVSSGLCIPVAIPGRIFCFLPLPVNTGLPFHTNGLFDIGKDRRSLCAADDETFGKKWNSALAEETLTQAYIHLMASLAVPQLQHCDKDTFLKEYYRLWCLKDANGIVPHGLVTSVKKYLPATKQKVVWSEIDNGCWLSPEEVLIFQDYKLHQYQEICQSCVTVMLENGYNVVNVPREVQSILMPHLREKKQVYDYQRFCIEIFFPNIHSVSPDIRDQHLIFLLKKVMSQDTGFGWASELIRTSCIPCQASTQLLPPHRLIDPRESLKLLYEPEEGRFPSVVFQKSQSAMAGLVFLGMSTRELKIDDLVERAQTVERLNLNDSGKAYERSYCILQYIERAYDTKTYMYSSKNSSEVRASLRDIPFIPAIKKPADIQLPWVNTPPFISPSQAFIPQCKNVVFSQKAVVDLESSTRVLSPTVLVCLGIDENTPTLEIAFSHLECLIQCLSDCDTTQSTVDYLEKEKVMADIYQYLQKQSRYTDRNKERFSVIKQKLQQFKFIWQDGHFLSANQVVLGWRHDCYPYICDLSQSNKSFEDLFRCLGVQDEATVSIRFLAAVLKRIAGDHIEEPVSPKVIDFIVAVVSKIVVKSHTHGMDGDHDFFLPDEKGIMRPASQLACDNIKGDWVENLQVYKDHFESGTGYFIHDNIPRMHALLLGARPILDAVLRNIEDDEFLVGTDYGQQEDLCIRLNQILRKYPPDYSILKEFIQNADDAQASEIVFVLDHRNYGDKKLFSQDENWKSLQHTPALCVFNNRKFTENHIEGITKLGEGGKEQSHEKIGRFGIGFNVAYHLTDCPSFVSCAEGGQPENFCVFDPTCKYVPKSSKRNPGRRWRVTEKHRLEFPEQFEPYLLQDLLPLSKLAPECLKSIDEGFVVFRLPLTRQALPKVHSTYKTDRGNLGYKQFDPVMVLQLINEFKQTAKDMLLFLHNLRCVSVFEIKEDGTYIHHFTTLSAIKPSHIKRYEEFGSHVQNKMKKAEPQMFSPLSVSYQLKVVHVETIEKKDGSFSTKEETKEWLIQQVAGSKNLSDTLMKQALDHGLRPVGGVAAHTQFNKKRKTYSIFCYLPTPIDSHLPVHINGHFLLDDSRKHLETQHGLTDWNEELATNTIAEAYADLIMEAKALVSTNPDACPWFYSLFPETSPTTPFSEQLAKAVYTKLLSRNPPILLQATPPGAASSQWLRLQGAHRGLFCAEFVYKRTFMAVNTELKEALIALGMPITSAPDKLYMGFRSIDTQFTALVTPQEIVNYLNTVDLSDATVLFIVKGNVQHLLNFLIKGFGKDIASIVRTLPLLIASDGSLQKATQIFESRFTTLLPECAACFVDPEFEQLSVGKKLTEYHIIVPLSLDFVAENIELPTTTKATLTCPSTLQTVKLIWQYVLSVSHGSHNLKYYFDKKTIIPANDGKLYPMCMSKAIVDSNSEDKCVVSVLKQIGCPTLDVFTLDPAFSDSDATKLTQLISPCNCSSANDVVQCIQLQEFLSYNAELSGEEVHTFIECVRKSSAIAKVADRLLHFQLFQTVSRSFVSLANVRQIFILPTDMPANGIADVAHHSQHIILLPCDQYTEDFYRLVIPQFSSIVVSIPTFYTEFMIPRIELMNTKDIYEHLKYIREHYHLTDSNSDFENVIVMLKEMPFIRHKGKNSLVSECCVPGVKFFQVFHSDKVLPPPWSEDRAWFPFFRTLGMASQVTNSNWLSQAYVVAMEAKGLPVSPDLKLRAKVLLSSLEFMITEHFQRNSDFQNELNTEFADFMNEVAQISFIYVDTPPNIQQLLMQLYSVEFKHCQFICFKDSVPSKDAKLAGLCRSVLPASWTFDHPPFVKLESLLLVEAPIKVETVVENLVLLCQKCTLRYIELATGNSTNICALKDTFMSHYAQLERMSESSNFKECLSVLREKACILLSHHDQTPVLVRPAQVVRSNPSQCRLEPFCYCLPSAFLQYEKVLNALAIPEQLQASHYAMILSNIRRELNDCNEKLSNSEAFLKVAESAYNELVRCMRQIPRGGESGIEAEELYLLSEDNELLKVDALVCNDVPWYAERLNRKNLKFLKPVASDDEGKRVPPQGLGVCLLSTIITEELHDDMHTPDITCIDEVMFSEGKHTYRCQVVQNLLHSLQSDEVLNGLCRVYYNEHNSVPSEEFQTAARSLRSVQIRCIQTQLRTVLCEHGKPVSGTEDFLFCHLVNESEQHVIYIAPHFKFDEDSFLKQLSSIICKLLGGDVRDQVSVRALFECSPSEISRALDKLRIAMYTPSSEKPKNYHQLGDIVPLKDITPQYMLIIMNFSEGEEVIYHSSDGNFIYAKVVKVITSEKVFKQTLTVETTDEKGIIASPLQVYKILTPSQRTALFSNHLSTGGHFATPLVLASVPQKSDDIRKWLQEIYLSSEMQYLSGYAICQITIRLIGHLHCYFVAIKKVRGVFPRAVMEIQELVCSVDLPSNVHPHHVPLSQMIDDLLEKLDDLKLEDDCSTEVEDKSECDVPIAIMTDEERLNPLPGSAIMSQERIRIVPPCGNYTSTCTDQSAAGATIQATAIPPSTSQPPVQSTQGTRFIPARTGYGSAIPLSTSQPQVQSSPGTRFTTTRRGYRSASRFQPVPACTIPDPPKPLTCQKSAKMWVDQAKADYRAAEILLKNMREDTLMDAETSSDAAENLPSRCACQFPALVCFLCHETVEKVLKAVLYAFCGLKSELLNSSHLVALLDSMKHSTHSPKHLIEPIEECVMQINEHENKSRLPNYQIPPCAPAVVYSHLDAQGAFTAVHALLIRLQREESLFGDFGQLPKPKFISALKSLGDGSEGKRVCI